MQNCLRFILIYLAVFSFSHLRADIEYTIQEIPCPEGYESLHAMRINEKGDISGLLMGDCQYSFYWEQGQELEVITYNASLDEHLGSDNSLYQSVINQYRDVIAVDLNDQGQICGYFLTGDNRMISFVWDKKQGVRELTTNPDFKDNDSYFCSINNHGDVAGVCDIKYDSLDYIKSSKGFFYFNAFDQNPSFNLLDSDTWLPHIDDERRILGYIEGKFVLVDVNQQIVSDLIEQGIASDSTVHILKNNTGAFATLRLIDNKHSMTLSIPGKETQYFDIEGAEIEISIDDMNDSNEVVGDYLALDKEFTAFIIDANGTMKDLYTLIDPNSGWEALYWATGINNKGQIVGLGKKKGVIQSFILTPL